MSNLTDFFGKASKRVAGKAPHGQPAFVAITSGSSSSPNMLTIFDHALNGIKVNKAITNDNPNYGTEFWQNGSWVYTNTPSGGSAYMGGHGVANNGYLGNSSIGMANSNVSGTYNVRPPRHNYRYVGYSSRLVGANIGIQQNYAISTGLTGSGGIAFIRSCPRSVSRVIAGIANVGGTYGSTRDAVKVQTVGMMTAGNYVLMSGGFSYNQQSGNAVIIERDNASNDSLWRPVLIKNFPDPAKYVSDQTAWGAAITAVTSTASNRVVGVGQNSTNISSRGTQGRNDGKVILCDNNDVVMMHPWGTSGVRIERWRWNESNNNWDAAGTPTTYSWNTISFSTGEESGVNFTQSLDGKTAIMMIQGYYTSTGYRMTMVDVATGNVKSYMTNDSTHSYAFIPLGASGFLAHKSLNASSAGLRVELFSWDTMHTDPTVDYFSAGFQSGPWGFYDNFLDVGSTSTAYPAVVPITDVDNVAIVLAEKGEI